MICSRCHGEAPEVLTKTGRVLKQCESCRAEQRACQARHVQQRGVRHATYLRDLRRRYRREAIAAYGGRCACCGEDHFEFLTFDHPDGGGARHRAEIAVRGAAFVGWLRRNNYPEGFRVLCYNCQSAYGYLGACPHQQ